MTTSKAARLNELRQQIDAIDDQIHDLLMARTKVVENVRELKQGESVKIRPAREAEILYRLMDRHQGNFPRRELTRIWREMIVATLSFEGPFSMAVLVPEDAPGYWDMARDQYGTYTPARRFNRASRVVEAVQAQEFTLGILPLPRREADADLWWRFLVSDAPDTPRIIARLPAAGPGNGLEAAGLEALVICPHVTPEATGRDRTYLAIEAEEDIGFTPIDAALNKAGFTPVFHQLWHDPNRPAAWTYFVEVFGFVSPADEKLTSLKADISGRISRVMYLGCVATPLTDNELDPPGDKMAGTKAEKSGI